jgi:hypothetical protein
VFGELHDEGTISPSFSTPKTTLSGYDSLTEELDKLPPFAYPPSTSRPNRRYKGLLMENDHRQIGKKQTERSRRMSFILLRDIQ